MYKSIKFPHRLIRFSDFDLSSNRNLFFGIRNLSTENWTTTFDTVTCDFGVWRSSQMKEDWTGWQFNRSSIQDMNYECFHSLVVLCVGSDVLKFLRFKLSHHHRPELTCCLQDHQHLHSFEEGLFNAKRIELLKVMNERNNNPYFESIFENISRIVFEMFRKILKD